MILIVGVTGVLGREAARQLVAAGLRVRGTTRNPASAEDLKKLGVEVVYADLIDPASVKAACQGAQQVIYAAHSLLGTGKHSSEAVDDAGTRALIELSKAAGVQHFVYLSAKDASPQHPTDFFRTKARIEDYLKASGLSYTILRPSAFMEHHVHNLLGATILTTGKTTIYGAGNNPNNFIAGRDIARFAVLAVTDPRLKNRTIDVGGPDNVTKNQVAELYGRFSGKTPKVSHVPTGVMKVMSPILRPVQPVLSRLMSFSAWADTDNISFNPNELLREFPMNMTHVEEFIREQAQK